MASIHVQRWCVLIAGMVMVAGVIAPWYVPHHGPALGGVGSLLGKVLLVFAGTLLLYPWLGDRAERIDGVALATLVIHALMVLVAGVLVVLALYSSFGRSGGHFSAGPYLTIAGALGAVISGSVVRR